MAITLVFMGLMNICEGTIAMMKVKAWQRSGSKSIFYYSIHHKKVCYIYDVDN